MSLSIRASVMALTLTVIELLSNNSVYIFTLSNARRFHSSRDEPPKDVREEDERLPQLMHLNGDGSLPTEEQNCMKIH